MIKKLGEIFKITSGGTPRRDNDNYFNNGNIPWVKTGDLKVKDLYKADEFITELGLENSSAKMFPENTVLIAMYGATIGACSILRIPACTNQACAAILPNEKVIPEFLYFFLRSRQPELISKGVGGGQPNISATILKDVEMPLPNIQTQQKIAQILSEADKARQLRKTANALTDQFLQNTFLNMFGDPVENEKGWKVKKIGDLVLKSQYGLSYKSNQEGNGLPILGMSNITNSGQIDLTKYNCVEISEKELCDYKLNYGDIIFNRTNSTELVGKTAMWKEEITAVLASYLVRLKLIPDCDPIFFTSLLNSIAYKKMFQERCKKAVGQSNISPTLLKEFPIYHPPIALQKQFADIASETELLRQKQQAHEQELEQLFKGLLQRYFG